MKPYLQRLMCHAGQHRIYFWNGLAKCSDCDWWEKLPQEETGKIRAQNRLLRHQVAMIRDTANKVHNRMMHEADIEDYNP